MQNASLLTEWRLRRPRSGLADLWGIDAPSSEPVQRLAGKGRVAYLPRLAYSIEPPAPSLNYRFANEHWKLPKNYSELARDRLTLSVQAPLSVAAELVEQKSSGNWLLHLVNFDYTRPVDNVVIKLRLPEG